MFNYLWRFVRMANYLLKVTCWYVIYMVCLVASASLYKTAIPEMSEFWLGIWKNVIKNKQMFQKLLYLIKFVYISVF